MYDRAKYKDSSPTTILTDDHVASIKYDGANYFVPFDSQGKPSFISRRESVKGGYPDRTESVPHLAEVRLPQFAGHVYNVELIHTGHSKNHPESHRQVSGILNSLSPRAVATQVALGPIRAVIHNVVNPEFSNHGAAIEHMRTVAKAWDRPELVYVPEYARGPSAIQALIDSTKRRGLEGVIIANLNDPTRTLTKVKHKIHHNLRIIRITQAIDKNGRPKNVMGAAIVADATGQEVGSVGTGWSAAQREEAWLHPERYENHLIQVESMGLAANRLRMPVYNGDADGEIDRVLS